MFCLGSLLRLECAALLLFVSDRALSLRCYLPPFTPPAALWDATVTAGIGPTHLAQSEALPLLCRAARPGDILAFCSNAPVSRAHAHVTHPQAPPTSAPQRSATAARQRLLPETSATSSRAGAFTLPQPAYEKPGRLGPAVDAFPNRLANVTAGSDADPRRLLLKNTIRDVLTMLCHAIARYIRGIRLLMARHASIGVRRASRFHLM